ncbi:MAG TPA: ribonuclease HII [Cytophagaceae bacterium]|nr:ribonuclease HII [Cytophagaceae bacterium]
MLKSSYTKDLIEAGLDEAGRGCLAGPVVAAAVILPKNFRHKFLNDSKQLTKNQRDELRLVIEKKAIEWAVAEVSHTEIDQINILNASFLAMHKAVDQLKMIPQLLLVDGNRFKKYKEISHECIVEGDAKYLSIAAASVLAKTYRDELMLKHAKDFPDYGWHTNMGYATLFHRGAIQRIGICPLHRLSFNLINDQMEIEFPEEPSESTLGGI